MNTARSRATLATLIGQGCLGAVAGCALGWSLAPRGWWPLGPLGVALLLSGGRLSVSARCVRGLGGGIAQFGIDLAFALQFSGWGYVVLVGFEACFVAASLAACPSGAGRLLSACGTFTLAEYLRWHWPFGGLPIGGVALGQLNGPFAVLARFGGPLLVAAGVFTCGALLANLGRILVNQREPAHALRAGVGLCVLVAAIAGAHFVTRGGPTRATITAVGVQGGGPRGLGELETPASHAFDAELVPTESLMSPGDLVVWPEDVVRLAGPDQGFMNLLGAQARRMHTTLLVGVTQNIASTRFLNEIVAFSPQGKAVARYEKVHAVPFGEYVPFRGLLAHVVNFAAVPRDAIVGTQSGAMTTPAGRIGLMISFETFFPARGRSAVRAGARVLVVPTNTASYATGDIPAQELAASRLQAISLGRYVLQVATTGYSALIDSSGSVLEQTGLGQQALLRARIPLLTGTTPYTSLGDAPTLLGALVAVLGGYALARRELAKKPRRWDARWA